jgi:hypothetical protein
MIVYVVLCEDRHYSPDPRVFVSVEDAMSEAHGFVAEYKVDPEDEDRKPRYMDPDQHDGQLFHQSISEEGDCVSVFKRELGT